MAEATLAKNLLIEIPAEAVSPVSALISALICLAIRVAEEIPNLLVLTSNRLHPEKAAPPDPYIDKRFPESVGKSCHNAQTEGEQK